MTLEECKASDKLTLTPEEAASVMGISAQSIRKQAQRDPDKLGFNVIVTESRVRIPRKPFLAFLGEACNVTAM